MADPAKTPDEDLHKGAVEDDTVHPDFSRRSHNAMAGQLGHRDQDERVKDYGTDFPEPDAEAEHTGG